MLRRLVFASFILLVPELASAQTAKFRIEEATIEGIQSANLRGELTSTRVVELYLNRIKTYNGTCVNQPDGVLGLGPITHIKNGSTLHDPLSLHLRTANSRATMLDS